MKRVTRWATSDGKEHETREAAKAHEAGLTALEKLGKLLQTSIQTGRTTAVLGEILMESKEVSAILASYRKSLPKEKPQEEGLREAA